MPNKKRISKTLTIKDENVHDLGQAFPGLEGFSPRNIWRMRAFFLAWSGVSKKLTQTVSETKMRIASKKLPVDFQDSLPTVEEIEAEFAGPVPLKPERKKKKDKGRRRQ